MGDCGCGCNGAGDCNDNLNSVGANAQVSGNIKYDGPDFECLLNPSINVSTNEGVNSILQKLLASVCALQNGDGNYLAFRGVDGTSSAIAIGQTEAIHVQEFDVDKIQVGEGLRIIVTGTLNPTATEGCSFSIRRYAYDPTGATTTSPVPFDVINTPANVGVDTFKYEITFFRRNDTELDKWVKIETSNGTYSYANYQSVAGIPDISARGIGIDFAVTKNGSEIVSGIMMSVEHLR